MALLSGKKKLLNAKRVLIFSATIVWHVSHYKTNWTGYDKKIYTLVFVSDFNETLIFSAYSRKILKYQISLKFIQWEQSCSMRRQTWRNLSNVPFNFANAPNKQRHHAFQLHTYLIFCTAFRLYMDTFLQFAVQTALINEERSTTMNALHFNFSASDVRVISMLKGLFVAFWTASYLYFMKVLN
jgi:hypothetical protein